MFHNLDAEMARRRVTKGDLAKLLGVRYATVIDKTRGKSRFYFEEALMIQRHFFPECQMEYLFETETLENRA